MNKLSIRSKIKLCAIGSVVLWYFYAYLLLEPAAKGIMWPHFWMSVVAGIPLCIATLGVVRFKKWARLVFIFCSVYGILVRIIAPIFLNSNSTAGAFSMSNSHIGIVERYLIYLVINSPLLILLIYCLYFYNKKEVKSEFTDHKK